MQILAIEIALYGGWTQIIAVRQALLAVRNQDTWADRNCMRNLVSWFLVPRIEAMHVAMII
jgi:hypothetical protein